MDVMMTTHRRAQNGVGRSRLASWVSVGVMLGVAACNDNPSAGSTAYQEGKLGNGSFLFRCDDSVACDRWSTNDAKDFPKKIATGATFDLRFVADGEEGSSLSVKGKRYDGVTLAPVAPYVSRGPSGFVSVKPGFGTVMVRDARGVVIDYAVLTFIKPDALVVYAAEYKGESPTPVDTFTIAHVGDRRALRTVAQHQREAIAGSLNVKWESSDEATAQVESYNGGVVTIVGKKAGTARLTAFAGALEKTVDVEVVGP